MSPNETNKIANIGRNDRDAMARATGVLSESQPQSPPESTTQSTPDQSGLRRLAGVGLAIATAGAVGNFAVQRLTDDAPEPASPSYEELAQENAQKPYDPAADEMVIGNIRVKPNNLEKNNASEAVLGDKRVVDYVVKNPDEAASLESSAMALPNAESYAVVERDIDKDGDTDAVAVPVEK